MQTVYVVIETKSDFDGDEQKVAGVFSDILKANEYIDNQGKSIFYDYFIEEFKIDSNLGGL